MTDASARQLLGELAETEREHYALATTLEEELLTPDARAAEDNAQRQLFVLQIVQPGLAGLMDGSVSTLAPLFAAAVATQNTHDAFIVGLAASIGAGISMGFAEALSDDGSLTGRGHPWIRGLVCGLMTTAGGLGHTVPFLVPQYRVAMTLAIVGRRAGAACDQLHPPSVHGYAVDVGNRASGSGRGAGISDGMAARKRVSRVTAVKPQRRLLIGVPGGTPMIVELVRAQALRFLPACLCSASSTGSVCGAVSSSSDLEEPFHSGVEVERRRLVCDEVLELAGGTPAATARGRGELRELVRVVEVVAPQADHVAAGDARSASSAMSTMRTLRAAGLRIEHLRERDRHEVAALHRDHHAVAAREQVLRRAVAEVARVLHVERDRVGAAQLVADVLGDDRGLDAELLQPLRDLRLQDLADVDLGDADVAVRVALDVLELRSRSSGSMSSTRPSAMTATPSRRP